MAARDEIVAAFRQQARWCDRLGSPFTARLLENAARDLESDGAVAGLLGAWPGDPAADALALRLAGALNALVLTGADNRLAAVYPPNDAPSDAAWRQAARAIAARPEYFRDYIQSPPQTNEVRRSAVLLGGFLEVARRTGLPLRILEIGASAGLNLFWDHYRYRLGERAWGLPSSPVELAIDWRGPLPPLDAVARVVERAGCDLRPIDLEDEAQRLRLRSYVWPDQPDRLARLDAAIALARSLGAKVAAADAGAWLGAVLKNLPPACATVVYHSIVWQYLPGPTRTSVEQAIATAARQAGHDLPLAWLRFESSGDAGSQVRLTLWPDGRDVLLATAHPHGASLHWLGSGAPG